MTTSFSIMPGITITWFLFSAVSYIYFCCPGLAWAVPKGEVSQLLPAPTKGAGVGGEPILPCAPFQVQYKCFTEAHQTGNDSHKREKIQVAKFFLVVNAKKTWTMLVIQNRLSRKMTLKLD